MVILHECSASGNTQQTFSLTGAAGCGTFKHTYFETRFTTSWNITVHKTLEVHLKVSFPQAPRRWPRTL